MKPAPKTPEEAAVPMPSFASNKNLMMRHEAADELVRIYEQRVVEYPKLIAAGALTQELADHRNAALLNAWSFTLERGLIMVQPANYFTCMDIAMHLAELREFSPAFRRRAR